MNILNLQFTLCVLIFLVPVTFHAVRVTSIYITLNAVFFFALRASKFITKLGHMLDSEF